MCYNTPMSQNLAENEEAIFQDLRTKGVLPDNILLEYSENGKSKGLVQTIIAHHDRINPKAWLLWQLKQGMHYIGRHELTASFIRSLKLSSTQRLNLKTDCLYPTRLENGVLWLSSLRVQQNVDKIRANYFSQVHSSQIQFCAIDLDQLKEIDRLIYDGFIQG